MSEDMMEKLRGLTDTIETIQKQIEQGMSPHEKEEAITKVSQTIELLQKMQSSEALKSARVVDNSDVDESQVK